MTDRPLPHLAGVEHRFLDVGGLRTHVALAGAGEPLLLLHGWPQHWWQWRHVIGPLSQHYSVICPDLRGLGWTDAPPDGYRPDTMADDITALLDQLGIDTFRAIGHDWGGLVGYLLALRIPTRMRNYTAINTVSPFLRPTPRVLADSLRLWHIPANTIPHLAAGPVPDWALRQWTSRSDSMAPEDRAIFLAQFREPARVQATVHYYRHLMTREIPRLLEGHYRRTRLRVPTLVLAGTRDPLFTMSAMRDFGSYADDLQISPLLETGHFPATEQPQQVIDRTLAFFDRRRAQKSPSKASMPPKSP